MTGVFACVVGATIFVAPMLASTLTSEPVIDSTKPLKPEAVRRGAFNNSGSKDIGPEYVFLPHTPLHSILFPRPLSSRSLHVFACSCSSIVLTHCVSLNDCTVLRVAQIGTRASSPRSARRKPPPKRRLLQSRHNCGTRITSTIICCSTRSYIYFTQLLQRPDPHHVHPTTPFSSDPIRPLSTLPRGPSPLVLPANGDVSSSNSLANTRTASSRLSTHSHSLG